MSNEIEKLLRKQWGVLYAKATTNTGLGIIESRKRFKKKYPYAKLNKFEFDVELDSNADVSKYIVRYKVGDGVSYDITSDGFTTNPKYRKDLFWKEFWEDSGTVQDFEKNEKDLPSGVMAGSWFGGRIYVSRQKSFHEWLGYLSISKPPEVGINDYKQNKHLASLYAAYISTYLCGISTYHFEEHPGDGVSKMVTSIMRYHLYFHMSRFLKYPELMDRFITSNITKIILKNRPSKLLEEKGKLQQTSEELGTWVAAEKKKGRRILNATYAKNSSGNVVGIRYDEITGVQKFKDLKNDWKIFVATKTNGITDTGVELLEQTVLSFVYAVLGAQADLRKPIVGDVEGEAKAVEQKFANLTKELIVQKDSSKYLGLFRTAVSSTKSRLNLAICPGVSLIPSKLVILDFTIPGYNNISKGVDPKTMVFGENNQINPLKIAVSKNAVDTTPTTPTVRTTPQVNQLSQPRLPEKKPETEPTTAVATRGPTQVAKYVPQHNKEIFYTGISMATIGVLVAMFII